MCTDQDLGLALLQRWRESEDGAQISATGGLPDGSRFDGVSGLKRALLDRPDVFVQTLTEKLMTFALGRGLERSDETVVNDISREVAANDYRFSKMVLEIVNSKPFQMRSGDGVKQ
jgi:hypothetical protein